MKLTSKLKNNSGQMILFVMIILSIMVSTSLAIGAVFIPKIKLLAEIKNSVGAVFAAESGLEWCLYNNQIEPVPTPPAPTMSNGATFQLTPANCSGSTIRAVGTYKGVARAFEISF